MLVERQTEIRRRLCAVVALIGYREANGDLLILIGENVHFDRRRLGIKVLSFYAQNILARRQIDGGPPGIIRYDARYFCAIERRNHKLARIRLHAFGVRLRRRSTPSGNCCGQMEARGS